MMRYALAIVLAAASAAADDLDALEARYGRDPLAMTLGNGRLTIGVDDQGRLCAVRWPSPGYHDQLTYDRDEETTGVTWGLLREGRVHWSSAWEWSAPRRTDHGRRVAVDFANAPLSVAGTMALRVDAAADRLAVEVVFDEPPREGDRIVWFADLTPTTRKLPELPVADFILDHLNDFACLVHPGLDAVVHFRPEQPGQNEWLRIERHAESGASIDSLLRFGDGTWMAWRVPDAAYHCFDTSETVPDEALGESGGGLAYGPGSASVGVAPVRDQTVTFSLVLAESSDAMRDRLRSEPAGAASATESDPVLDTLRVLQDAATGSIVRGVSVRPPLNRDWPRYGAWAVRAFDLAGERERARALLEFYLARVSPGGTLPAGALPFAVYPDGIPAALRGLVDTQAAAWVLWAAAEHARTLDPPERTALLDAWWPHLSGITGFIVDWTEDTTGVPWHAYDPASGRDERDRSQLFTGHLGLSTMIALAEATNRDVPESWTRRKRQWDALLESHSRAPGFAFAANEPLPFWITSVFPPDHPAVRQALRDRIANADRKPAGVAARQLAEIALYHEAAGAPETDALRTRVRDLRALPQTANDAYVAATLIVAEAALSGAESQR